MDNILSVDLEALRALADRQSRSANNLRDIDLHNVFGGPHHALAGSATADQCARAAAAAQIAIAAVATRVEHLEQTNRRAAATIGVADDEYARWICTLTGLD